MKMENLDLCLKAEKVMMLLGSPCTNIEMTKEQIINCIVLSKKMAKSLCRHFECPNLFDYVFEKLIIINCKKTWSNSLYKYDFTDVNIKTYIYDSAIDDENRLIQLLIG